MHYFVVVRLQRGNHLNESALNSSQSVAFVPELNKCRTDLSDLEIDFDKRQVKEHILHFEVHVCHVSLVSRCLPAGGPLVAQDTGQSVANQVSGQDIASHHGRTVQLIKVTSVGTILRDLLQ